MRRLADLQLWPLRVVWVLLGLIGGGPAGDALAARSTPVVILVAAVAWAGWAVALVAMLVPRTLSLTVVRAIVPAAWIGSMVAAAGGDTITALDIAGVAVATAAVMLALSPWVTDGFVDGSSYGPELRLALRTPPAIVAVAVLTWIVVLAGAVTGPLLLVSRQWVAGGIATVVGAAAVAAGTRSLHQLSRRWLVLVPTGMVLHDSLVMPEPQLFLRQTMSHLGPASAGAEGAPDDPSAPTSEDLTAGASGLVLELVVREPVELLVRNGRDDTSLRSVDRVLFSPARPAALLAAARERRLPTT